MKRAATFAGVGCGVGLFCGVFGAGGGAISVPAMSLCMPELSHREVLGTSLAAMVLPAMSGIARHSRAGSIVFRAAVPLAVGTALGSFCGARYVALQVDEGSL